MDREEILRLSVKHNFWTWSAQKSVEVIPIEKAEGVYFWDLNGKRYLDFNSMVMCVNIGHGNQKVIDAIVNQAKHLPFAGPHMATEPRARLGQLLSEILPEGLTRYLYTLGGSEANENAIKLARASTGKFKILTRYRSYHGATAGALSLTGDKRRLAWEPNLIPGIVHFIDPYKYRSVFYPDPDMVSDEVFTKTYLDHLEEIIAYEGPETIAAILIESVTGTNGIIIPPNGYILGIREICNKYDILMITDEVMSGFGRTGEWFAVDHWNVTPDIMTMAKGLTSGYAPLGAVAMTEKVASFFDDRVYQGGLTYNGHPISLAAAIANIEVLRDDNLISHSKQLGHYLNKQLLLLKDKHNSVGDVRSIGLFGVIELVKDRKTKEALSPFNKPLSPLMKIIKKKMFDSGLYVHINHNHILIIPPLIISQQTIDEGLEIIDQALDLAEE